MTSQHPLQPSHTQVWCACRQTVDWAGLVKARLQRAIKLLASLLDVVLVEVAHVHSMVRIMAEALALNGLDVLRVAAAGETNSPPFKGRE